MFIFYNPNPAGKLVGDCVIRAISKLIDKPWEDTYIELSIYALMMFDMPSSNNVWGSYLHDKGFKRYIIPDTCPECYTVKQFCLDNPHGEYLLAIGTHVVTAEDGNYYDAWDSGEEIPIYYWKKGEVENA